MDLINEQVIHRTFGKGRITALENGYLTIAFDGETGQKKFCYPAAFDQFLHMAGNEAADFVSSELQEYREKLQAEEAARLAIQLHREKERRAALQSAAKNKTKKAAAKK